LGRDLSPAQSDILLVYREWLDEEAIPAGALGPAERDRLDDRHIADSLLFLHGWDHDEDPESIWDLGSGAGLPGIPLAVLLPDTQVTLVDRSSRRSELMRRAVRILGLDNVEVEETEIEDLNGTTAMIVSRATLGPLRLDRVVRGHLDWNGMAVVGGSWVSPPTEVPPGWEIKEILPDSLDRTVWLLIMRG
jgi:16S rRNA G527 N7-methylase RsmG